MNQEIIKRIKLEMKEELSLYQMEKLENVLKEFLGDETFIDNTKEKKNLIKKFINTKKIEGCSVRTEQYYLSTLSYFEKNIGCNICLVETEDIRDYLINYQRINNCSNVTLDTVRRILSSFYKWLEESIEPFLEIKG